MEVGRFGVNYNHLDALTVEDKYPIPIRDELLDTLERADYFSKIVLRSGYFLIVVEEQDMPKTAFITHMGLYEFLMMPFGLTSGPATFQSLMNKVFSPFLRKFLLVFLMTHWSKSKGLQEHL